MCVYGNLGEGNRGFSNAHYAPDSRAWTADLGEPPIFARAMEVQQGREITGLEQLRASLDFWLILQAHAFES